MRAEPRIRAAADCRRRSQKARAVHAGRHGASADPLLTIAEVLAELKVARSTFDTWRGLGCAPQCIKLPNGQIRVRRCALDAWLASHTDLAGAG
jgi:predicted DNA-binding transcriptional regulator AlpA